MPTEKCQLEKLSHEDIQNIETTAPRFVRLTRPEKGFDTSLNECRTVQDLYDKAPEYITNGDEYGVEVRLHANSCLLVEIEKLARVLMEKILNLQGDKETEVRNDLVKVLDYQTSLKRQIETDSEKVKNKGLKGSGYLLFNNLTDEEIEYFWNGK